MKVAIGQFEASPTWEKNLKTCHALIASAKAQGAELLVLPEGVLARFTGEPSRILDAAQTLDGPFVSGIVGATAGSELAVVVGVHEPAQNNRVYNTAIAASNGQILASYRKLHLYDAFGVRESDRVQPGDRLPPVFEHAGLRIGLMTCYDVRFPEVARVLSDDGADLIALPAAWRRGLLKERHWDLLVAARALENTCYIAAAGECGPDNIGGSMLVDPMGVVRAQLGEAPGLLIDSIDPERLRASRQSLPVISHRRLDIAAIVRQSRPSRPDSSSDTWPRAAGMAASAMSRGAAYQGRADQ